MCDRVIMLLIYILAAVVNTLVEYINLYHLNLSSSNHSKRVDTCRRLYTTVVIQLHELFNWLQVDVHCPAAESPSVDSIQLCITAFRVFISAFVS